MVVALVTVPVEAPEAQVALVALVLAQRSPMGDCET
jgi:hypothetical protein